MRSFASDNNAGVHPSVMTAMAAANRDHALGYGDDEWTRRAEGVFRDVFGDAARMFIVFNGTGANCVALEAVTRHFNSILCSTSAHIYNDECGAPGRMTGCQLTTIPTPDGKLTPELVEPHLHQLGNVHHAQPAAIYISQTTELGTVYTLEETRLLADFAHKHGLLLHVDGARLANACAALGCTLREATTDAGVDALSFGGTKNGMMLGEAVVALRPEVARDIPYIRKQSTQLASKMRYLAAGWEPYFGISEASGEPLWLENALRANDAAQKLAAVLARVPGARFTQKVESNQIFCILPRDVLARLREHYFFYMWNDVTGEARFVTCWDTTDKDIEDFAEKL